MNFPLDALLWVAGLIYLCERLRPLGDRTLQLFEMKRAPISPRADYPLDILRHIAGQSEQWARDDTRKFVDEQWDEHHNWDAVRTACGLEVAHVDSPSTLH